MSRYIEYEQIMAELEKEVKLADDWKTAHEIANVVKYAPSIDIVPCKECKLNETDNCPMVYYTPLEDGGIETRWWNRPDDFCSWGEREGE